MTAGRADRDQQDADLLRDRAIRLFTFLRELCQLRSRTVRRLDEYDQHLWLADVPREQGCFCIAWDPHQAEPPDSWVEIRKPKLVPPPKPLEVLRPWMDAAEIADSSRDDFPSLRDTLPADDTRTASEPDRASPAAPRTISDHPQVRAAWEDYVLSQWYPWAEKDRPLQKVQRVYNDLYSMYQQQQRMGEEYEAILGLGLLVWRTPPAQDGEEIRRHLLCARVALSFDAAKARIAVAPSPEGIRLDLEDDMLPPNQRPGPDEDRRIRDTLRQIGDDLWDDGSVHEILRAWVNTFPEGREYDAAMTTDAQPGARPLVAFAPALILRKRTQRSLVRVFEDICAQLRDPHRPVPRGVVSVVRDPRDSVSVTVDEAAEEEHPAPGLEDIYFPRAANDAQLEVARQLDVKKAVLVQGPPGTGKSQTIANLVCHLLARGQRVLVTSHTPRALRVLRHMLPTQVAALCVVALGDDADSMQGLEESVSGITHRYDTWDPRKNASQTRRWESELNRARQDEAALLGQLRAVREAETYRHPLMFGSYEGTLQHIACALRAQEPTCGWMPPVASDHADPPLSSGDAVQLLTLIRRYDAAAEAALSKSTVDHGLLPSPGEFASLVEALNAARSRYENAESARSRPEYPLLVGCNHQLRADLLAVLQDLDSQYVPLANDTEAWIRRAALEVLARKDGSLRQLEQLTSAHLAAVGSLVGHASSLSVAGLETHDASVTKADAQRLLDHLEAGGGLGWFWFRPGVAKECSYLWRGVRVNGALCDEADRLQSLIHWLTLNEHLDALDQYWSGLCPAPTGMPLLRGAAWDTRLASLRQCLALSEVMDRGDDVAKQIPGMPSPSWHDPVRLSELADTLRAAATEVAYREAEAGIEAATSSVSDLALDGSAHPVVAQVAKAAADRDPFAYSTAYSSLAQVNAAKGEIQMRDRLLAALRAQAPALRQELAQSYEDPLWDERMSHFDEAWNWARADRWFRRLTDPDEPGRLSRDLEQVRGRVQDCLAELAAAKAWQQCLSRLTEQESQALRAWQKAVRRIGKGTGEYASQHRREARANMERCRSAIPAWVMPLYRVAETVEINPAAFDVVIVDEASQSGPEALFLHYLADSIVVVGDDKQISPDFVGIDKQEVNALRDRHIADLPHSDALGADHSFFDQAYIRYSTRIALREHFRCMPEIIQFSNRYYYSHEPLIPLKQYGSGRLTPTVRVHYVPNGYQRGTRARVTNPPEAEALVQVIAECCSRPEYAGKSLGVITLLGAEQARLIRDRLMATIGPEEMERRQLHCGDAYAFQGDERDVMFLSVVAALGEDHRLGVLSDASAERRFNVAASRAREQMWLFHSVALSDLSPKCQRYRLIEYCQNPKLQPTEIAGIRVDELRRLAASARRDRDGPPEPFESWFEVDVCLDIVGRGYRVLPQFEVAGRRIDLVVEGMRGRLAVECDGDTWHGPEQYEQDSGRERQLRRSGYRFWRVGGGAYYRDPPKALESLWETLQDMGIHPEGTDAPGHGELAQPGGTQQPAPVAPPPSPDLREAPRPPLASLTPVASPQHASVSGAILTPYRRWEPRPLPDPRTAPLAQVIQGLVEIVAAEGPMVCERAYHLYASAVGIYRVGKHIRAVLNKAVHRAVRLGRLQEVNEYGVRDQLHQVVRSADAPEVVARELGDREMEHVPPSELAELMRVLVSDRAVLAASQEDLFREIRRQYGLTRLTANARRALERGWTLWAQSGPT